MSDDLESLNSSGHGGARAGAGRKRKRDLNGTAIQRAEKQIRDRLPEVIDKMIELSMGVLVQENLADGAPLVYKKPPDFKAAAYLIDRIMGKPTERKEISGPEGGPVPVQFFDYEQVAGEVAPDE